MRAPAPAVQPRQSSAAAVPEQERGGTRIADRVVAKAATQAAREALRGSQPFTRLDTDTSAVPRVRPPRASVEVRSHRARVRLSMELPYPGDIAGTASRVREHVAARVRSLTGMTVTEVVIVVERLRATATAGEHRRVR